MAPQSIQNGFGSVYAVNVVRSTNSPALGGGFTWTVTFIATDLAPLPMYADGHLLRGTGAMVTVNTGYCPFTAQSRAGVVGQTSSYGVVGETFLATLSSGLPGDYSQRAAQATVTHVASGLYSATYTSPRIGTYNLTVAKADRGGLQGLYYNNRWLYGSASEERLDSVLDFQWSTDDLITETGKDYISIRWTGYLLPAFSEVYTIQVTVNDGARVWVDDVLLIDQYDNDVPDGQSASVFTGTQYTTQQQTNALHNTHTNLFTIHNAHTNLYTADILLPTHNITILLVFTPCLCPSLININDSPF